MNKIIKSIAVAGLIAMLAFTVSRKDSSPQPTADAISNAVILKWNEVAFGTIGGLSNQHSLLASRMYALMHAAMHDAVNATQPRFETYVYHGKASGANPEVAAASAAHAVLKTLFPARTVFLDSVFNTYLSSLPQTKAVTKGTALGVKVAHTVLGLEHNANGNRYPIAQPAKAAKPGDYKLVPPFDYIFAPFWEDSKLFSLQRKDQFRPQPPPALSSPEYAKAFNEVKKIGMLNSTARTADQTLFAKYWYEDSQEGWNHIARIVAANKKTGLFATARLFALLNFAIADSYTAGWDAKMHYNFWRPFTAIREAAADSNSATKADRDWLPAEPTPPIQDYPSTHSALGNAGATVLASVFGDQTTFTMGSSTALPPGSSRSFTSFSQAADENAASRVIAGIHFRFSCNAGQALGNQIGAWTVANHLKPLSSL